MIPNTLIILQIQLEMLFHPFRFPQFHNPASLGIIDGSKLFFHYSGISSQIRSAGRREKEFTGRQKSSINYGSWGGARCYFIAVFIQHNIEDPVLSCVVYWYFREIECNTRPKVFDPERWNSWRFIGRICAVVLGDVGGIVITFVNIARPVHCLNISLLADFDGSES